MTMTAAMTRGKPGKPEPESKWTLPKPDPTKTWTPVRKGDIYCSTACGYGCTYEDYARNVRLATELSLRLGPGWQFEVAENGHGGGFHYTVKSPDRFIQVFERWERPVSDNPVERLATLSAPRGYSAFFNYDGGLGGHWSFPGGAAVTKTPEEAIRAVVAMAREERDRISKALDATSALVDGLNQPLG